MREGKLFMHGADVDDLAAGFGLHAMPDECLGHEKRPLQIYVQHEIVILLGDIPEIGTALEPRIVDEDVHAAKLRDRFGDESLAVGHLPTSACIAAAFRPHFWTSATTSSAPGLVGAVTQRDVRAFVGEALHDGTADALVAARDRHCLTFQPICHGPSP